jgi:hypothetical protein
MTTRTVIVPNIPDELADYHEYLAANAWPVVRERLVENGRYVQITFAIG